MSAYINDLLIYSNLMHKHREHMRVVLQKLQEAGLHVNIDKCEFHIEEMLYLGIIISRHGIKIDPIKVAAVKEWIKPENIKDI